MMKLFFAAAFLLLSTQAFAQTGLTPLAQEDVALLDSVTRNCGTSHMEYRQDELGSLQGQTSISLARIAAGMGSYTHVYSQQMWDAIKAAAVELKNNGWIVTDTYYANSRLKDAVLSVEQFDQIASEDDKIMCLVGPDPIPTCNDPERRIARELFGFEDLKPCGEEKPWEKEHPNALRPQHVRMITALLDRGYVYNEATRKFEKSGGTADGEPATGAQGLR